MGYKMGHARNLEPVNDASKPRDSLDLSIADLADSPILDDQAVQEILESGPYRLLDPSTGDSRDDKDKVDPSRTDVPDHDTLTNETDSVGNDAGNGDATSTIKVPEARVIVEEITEGTTMQHRYQPKAARVSWARRLLNWFMRRFWQSDFR